MRNLAKKETSFKLLLKSAIKVIRICEGDKNFCME